MSSNEDPGSRQLPESVRLLLTEHIDSYEQLEVLLLLHRDRSADWTAAALGERLDIPRSTITAALRALRAGGLVQSQREKWLIRCAYAPASPALDDAVRQLARLYAEHPIPIIRLMTSNAIERVRTRAIRTFAESFVLRRKKDRR